MASLRPRPGILNIKPYVPGSGSAPGAQKIYKMSSNESALGASPKAVDAYVAAAKDIHLYPNGASTALRDKIDEVYGLDANRIVCGAGSDELIQLLTKAYAGPGDNVVLSEHGFLMYALAAMTNGAEPRFAKETNLTADVDAILDSVDNKTRIVFLANPNNPTGTYIPADALRRLREELRDDVLLVVDSAYAEYMEEPDYEPGAMLVDDFDNVVMTRTFSKIYGLAALRVGWVYCPAATADVLNRIRGPFNVTIPAQVAAAAALGDRAFVERNRAFNKKERKIMAQRLDDMGLEYTPSHGNFILVKFPNEPGLNAGDVQTYLKSEGVIVREMGPYKLGDCLRISIGEQGGNRKLLELLGKKFV